ncbi:hypothetical protein LS482_03420 [Sinomicrobium kalidii]|uniref:hypothetical protein n=1 Tax=Sinomicrobium kalidii TaxID=2900738 RepID=UPI001E4FF9D6|nr:hypothetical protein [Sinomicrobium kalidii]UGU16930.1 hypothetical protein LS482_03420 [Sinomicrobium kalidii]
MKHTLVILALLICLRPLFPVLEYAANYDYIVNVLCVNKEQPELHCDGKCYLMGAIAKEVRKSDDSKSTSLPKITELPLLYVKKNDVPVIPPTILTDGENTAYPYHNSYSFLFVYELLKPPISLS